MAYSEGYQYKVINAAGATVVSDKPCIYGGYRILGAAGALTMDVHDHDSAAQGTKLDAGVSVNEAADKVLNMGIHAARGLTVNLSGDPTDGQILVLYK